MLGSNANVTFKIKNKNTEKEERVSSVDRKTH